METPLTDFLLTFSKMQNHLNLPSDFEDIVAIITEMELSGVDFKINLKLEIDTNLEDFQKIKKIVLNN